MPGRDVAASNLRRAGAVTVVQDAVSYVIRYVVLQAARKRFELAIQVYDVRCFVERTDECVERSLRLALLAKRRVIEPADAKAESARHAEEIVDRQGETLFPDRLRRSFEIREAVLV